MHGSRLDSHERQIRQLFRQVASGISFVRIAQGFSSDSIKAKALELAKAAHDDVASAMTTAPLTPEEREQLQLDLDVLRRSIDACTAESPR